MMAERFTASGVAIPVDAGRMFEEICEHFAEHATVTRSGNAAVLESPVGNADIQMAGGRLSIEISCPTAPLLEMVRSLFAEHLFQFADGEPLELTWSDAPRAAIVSNFREIRVVSARNVTPHMRRVTVACDDVAHFMKDGLHVRLLIPPKGRAPVWPQMRPDGRIQWPAGDDALSVRAYTIRSIDLGRGEMDIDFVLHEGQDMPGANWALQAAPGDVAGLFGPGGGGVPEAQTMILAGDEAALPAIARIADEVPAGTRIRIFLEVADAAEEQPLPSAAEVSLTWMHRNGAAAGTTRMIETAVRDAVRDCGPETYLWVACEQTEARTIRDFVKQELAWDRGRFLVAGYWGR